MKWLHVVGITALLLGVAVAHDPKLPLVGILLQNGPKGLGNQFPLPETLYTFVPASYVEWISQTGAIPVLIPHDIPKERLNRILDTIQGVLITGGSSDLGESTGTPSPIMQTISHIIQHSKTLKTQQNKDFPIFGICMGFQSLFIAFSDPNVITSDMDDKYKDHSVEIVPELWEQSKFFKNLDVDTRKFAFEEGKVFYWHGWGIRPQTLEEQKYAHLRDEFLIVGHSTTDTGIKFAALVEHKQFPLFGTQFHPEKTQYERGPNIRFLDRSSKSIDFVVDLAFSFVEVMRPNAKLYSEIPDWIKVHFAQYHTPINSFHEGYEKVYMFPKLYDPAVPASTAGPNLELSDTPHWMPEDI